MIKIFFKLIKWFVILILFSLVTLTVLNFSPWAIGGKNFENKWRSNTDYPLVIPHGGAKALYPENTIKAFYETSMYDAFEVDLALTKDDILISHHDLNFAYTGDTSVSKAVIRELTYDEVVELFRQEYYHARNFVDTNGNKPYEYSDESELVDFVPAKLTDLLSDYQNRMFILEIKDTPEKYNGDDTVFKLASEVLIANIEESNMQDNVLIGSFSDDVIDYVRDIAPGMYTGAGTKEVTNFSIFSAFHIDFFYQAKSEVLILPNAEETITGSTANLLDMIPNFFTDSIAKKDDNGVYRANLMHQQLINDAHRKNMAVIYWTINDPEEMRMLIELGVDGIITDDPVTLASIIAEMKSN